MELALETHALEKSFGDFTAVAGIDLVVPRGCFFGFLGPNGAGKSTTIKCLTGLLQPTAGTMRILGRDPVAEPLEVKRRVGVVPEDLALFDRLSGNENLEFVGRVHGLAKEALASRVSELIVLMGLADAADGLAGDYSHGMRKKLALACALLPAPQLLFLDEPFEGIDAVASNQIRQLLETFVDRGGTVFVTSHILQIVERLCDHLAVIHHGQLVAQGTLSELASSAGKSLEELFLELVGGPGTDTLELSWLTG